MQPIKLQDGTELVPLEQEEKEQLELEIKIVLDKYNALYVPSIREDNTLTSITKTAVILLFKKKPSEILSNNPEVNPLINQNGESNNTTEETPETN